MNACICPSGKLLCLLNYKNNGGCAWRAITELVLQLGRFEPQNILLAVAIPDFMCNFMYPMSLQFCLPMINMPKRLYLRVNSLPVHLKCCIRIQATIFITTCLCPKVLIVFVSACRFYLITSIWPPYRRQSTWCSHRCINLTSSKSFKRSHHSSVELSAPTILRTWVQIPAPHLHFLHLE